MLKNTSKKPLRKNDSDANANPIQDPWLITNKVWKPKIVSEAWQLTKEPYPLISPAGSLGVPSLTSHQSTSAEILLEDELKLKTIARSPLKQQLKKALALIYWVKTIKTKK